MLRLEFFVINAFLSYVLLKYALKYQLTFVLFLIINYALRKPIHQRDFGIAAGILFSTENKKSRQNISPLKLECPCFWVTEKLKNKYKKRQKLNDVFTMV